MSVIVGGGGRGYICHANLCRRQPDAACRGSCSYRFHCRHWSNQNTRGQKKKTRTISEHILLLSASLKMGATPRERCSNISGPIPRRMGIVADSGVCRGFATHGAHSSKELVSVTHEWYLSRQGGFATSASPNAASWTAQHTYWTGANTHIRNLRDGKCVKDWH